MRIRKSLGAGLAVGLWLAVSPAEAGGFDGTWVVTDEDGTYTLTLEDDGSGGIRGRARGPDLSARLQGGVDGSAAAGTVSADDGEVYGFVAELGGGGASLEFTFFPFDEYGNPAYDLAESAVFAMRNGAPAPEQPTTPGAGSARGVQINGVPLSDQRLQELEAQYQTQIPGGSYWYDTKCGAWGVEGGPTLGFLVAGLDLPGLEGGAVIANLRAARRKAGTVR